MIPDTDFPNNELRKIVTWLLFNLKSYHKEIEIKAKTSKLMSIFIVITFIYNSFPIVWSQ